MVNHFQIISIIHCLKMLEKINSTEDLKKLTIKEKEELAKDIREYILETVRGISKELVK